MIKHTGLVLTYGDYPALIKRVLDNLSLHLERFSDLRIGLNAVSEQTMTVVTKFAEDCSIPVLLFEAEANPGKYPLMTEMLFTDKFPLAPRVMWFDDDSYFHNLAPSWWRALYLAESANGLVGKVHYTSQQKLQHKLIPKQPWYRGKTINRTHRYTFVVGGWWTADSQLLIRNGYPFKEIWHNGGDVLLGELHRQNSLPVVDFERANCRCRYCSKRNAVNADNMVVINEGELAGRRGIGRKLSEVVWPYTGVEYPPQAFKEFELKITVYRR